MAPAARITLDELNDSLLQESSKTLEETHGLQWEWNHYLKLQKFISQIQEKEATRDAGDVFDDLNLKNGGRRLEAVGPFLDWLKSNNVNPTTLRVENLGTAGLGLVTQVPIKTGDEVLVIPERIMMTTTNAKESKLKILSEKDPVLRSMPNVLLSLFLLYERFVTKDGSFWKPYIDILPTTYDTVLYFTIEEMELLKRCPHGFREALRMYRNIARQYAYFHQLFKRGTESGSRALRSVFTYKRYMWAASSAMTRQNSLTRPGDCRDELCLIPLWDLCNHEASGQFSNSYHPEEKYLACYASHDYEPNTEFLIYYGERTSVDHFVHGGFVPDTYFADIFNLEIGIGVHDPERSRKEKVLKGFGMKCQEAFAVRPAALANLKLKSVFIFVRIFQANTELLDQLEASMGDWSFLTTPTVEVWQFLATRFTILKRSADNSKLSLLKIMSSRSNSTNSSCSNDNAIKDLHLPNKQKMILQLILNEIKLLDILAHCAKDQLVQLQEQCKEKND